MSMASGQYAINIMPHEGQTDGCSVYPSGTVYLTHMQSVSILASYDPTKYRFDYFDVKDFAYYCSSNAIWENQSLTWDQKKAADDALPTKHGQNPYVITINFTIDEEAYNETYRTFWVMPHFTKIVPVTSIPSLSLKDKIKKTVTRFIAMIASFIQ